MPHKRFLAIMAALQCYDYQTTNLNDPLNKVHPIYNLFRKSLSDLYYPYQFISADERMVKSKAHFFFKQYIMNKPVKWGFKLWTLARSVTGYTVDMVVYTGSGKRGNVQRDDFAIDGLAQEGGWEGWMGNRSLTQLGPSVVIKLCKPYFRAGHVLVTDNFYNNVPLFQFLKNQGMYAIGTAKVNSTGFPQELKDKAAWEKKAVRGEVRFVRTGDVLCLQWMDHKCVSMYGTLHRGQDFDFAMRNTKENGQHQKKPVFRPKCIADYNTYMGGVDLSDQMFRMYSVASRTQKWWKTLFFHFFDIAVVNAYLIWKHSKPADLALHMADNYSLLDFRIDLAIQLAELNDTDRNLEGDIDLQGKSVAEVLCTLTRRAEQIERQQLGDILPQGGGRGEGGGLTVWHRRKQQTRHMPVSLTSRRRCKVCSTVRKAVTDKAGSGKANVERLSCDRTALCLLSKSGENARNYFAIFHSSVFDQFKDYYVEKND